MYTSQIRVICGLEAIRVYTSIRKRKRVYTPFAEIPYGTKVQGVYTLSKEGEGVAKKSRATTIRLPTAYDDFFARFDSKSAAVRTAVDFYLQAGERLDRLEASVLRLERLIESLLDRIERGMPLPAVPKRSPNDEIVELLAGGLDDF